MQPLTAIYPLQTSLVPTTRPTLGRSRLARFFQLAGRMFTVLGGLLLGATQARALTATPATTEGPYYTLSTDNNVTTVGNSVYDGHFYTAEGADNDLTHIYSTSTQCSGSIYLLSGKLYNTSGTAIAGAVIEIWEADNGGIYWYNSSNSGTNSYTSRDQKFQGYGRATTDSTGAWSFRTIKPGLYTGRIRHFHLRININGTLVLTTQFMFSEDSASFSSDSVAAPLVQAGTMSYVTLTTTSGTDSSGASVLIGSKDLVVSYSGTTSGAPTITTQPTSVTPATGSSATFTVAATGTGTLSYQWYKGKSVAAGGTVISGATGASYTLSSVTSSSVGAYYCVVTNTSGSTTAAVASNAAALTIGTTTGSAPTITTQPTSQSVATGSNATFTVAASNATSYQWYKGTVGSGSAISGATSASYTLSSVTSSNAGTYYVIVSNSSGSTTSSGATLTVTSSAPTITSQPTSQSAAVGGSATFSVTATGTGTLSYQWYFGTTAISGATSASYTIASVATANAGSYAVKVTNTGGTTTSNSVTLTVSGNKPTITSQPATTSIYVGEGTSFTVGASSDSGTLSYQWYKGSSAISGATSATYTIASAALSDAGTYYAVVTNPAGSTTSSAATLTVVEPYAAFLTKYGLNATTGAPDADPDGDGIPNGLEFLLGGNPIQADTSILPTSVYQLVNGSPAVVFSFNLVVPVGGTTWTVEYSSDLLTWTTATQGVNGVTMTMSGTAVTTSAGRAAYPVTVTIPTTATQTFARLRVTPAQ